MSDDSVSGASLDVSAIVLALDAERYAAFLGSDVERLERLLDDRLGYGHSNTLRDTKAALLEKLASGSLRYHRLDHEVLDVTVANEVTVLVHGTMNASAVSAGTQLELDSVTLSVWVRAHAGVGAEWRLLAFQPTPRPKV